MNTLSTAKLIDITSNLYLKVMLAAMALLHNRIIRFYGLMMVRVMTIADFCIFAYARKRVINRVIHDRKNAIFTIFPNDISLSFGKGQPPHRRCEGHQRGLLKDKTQRQYFN